MPEIFRLPLRWDEHENRRPSTPAEWAAAWADFIAGRTA
jgi:hypothetical protein